MADQPTEMYTLAPEHGSLGSNPMPVFGKVIIFDEDAGLGVVRGDDGSELGFHCSAIAGGSRRIPEGARVAYSIVPAHLGLLEATGVTIVTLSPQTPV
jgi:cold shock CspA family protein